MRLFRLSRTWVIRIVAIQLAILVYFAWPGTSTMTVSEETTHVTGPLDESGNVDFQAALNERLGQGIAPENNANVLLWQAIGPRPENAPMPPGYFQLLGIESPPEKGEYFVSWEEYYDANLKRVPHKIFGLFEGDSAWERYWSKLIRNHGSWPWKADENPQIVDWLQQNETALTLVREASFRTQYFHPLLSNSVDPGEPRLLGSKLSHLSRMRGLAVSLSCRAMRNLAEGQFRQSWEELLTVQRLGRLLAKGGLLIEHLVGNAVVNIASNAMATFLSHAKLTAPEWQGLLNEFSRLPDFDSIDRQINLGERLWCLDALSSIARQYLAPKAGWQGGLFVRSVDWDPALRRINGLYDRLATSSRLPDRQARKQALDEISDELTQAVRSASAMGFLEKQVIGKGERGDTIVTILLSLMLPAVEIVVNAWERTTQIQSNLQVALALAAFHAEHGKFPDRLDSLSPKYLQKIPNDLFSGKPLNYRLTEDGYLLYSIGVNELDEDGHWVDDDPKGDDPRIRIPKQRPFAAKE